MDKESVKADKTYGTSRANAYRLMEDCLNLKRQKYLIMNMMMTVINKRFLIKRKR